MVNILNIKIDKDTELKSDVLGFIIVVKGKNVAYTSTVEGALKAYYRYRTKVSDATTFEELIQEIKGIKKELDEQFKYIKEETK